MRPGASRSSGGASGLLMQLPKDVPGLVNALHWAIQFTSWAATLRNPPTWQQISERFGVSRATAYRYRSALEAARAQNLIPNAAGEREISA